MNNHIFRIGKSANDKNVIPELTQNNMVLVEQNDPFEKVLEGYKEKLLGIESSKIKYKKNGEMSKTSKDKIEMVKNLTIEDMASSNQIDLEKEKSLLFHFPLEVEIEEKKEPETLEVIREYFEKLINSFKKNNVLINSAVVHNDEKGKPHIHIMTPMCSVDTTKGARGYLVGENATFSKMATGKARGEEMSVRSLDKIDRKHKKDFLKKYREQNPGYMDQVIHKIDNGERAKYSLNQKDYEQKMELERREKRLEELKKQYHEQMRKDINKVNKKIRKKQEELENEKEKLKMEKRKQQEELENEKERLKMLKIKQQEEYENTIKRLREELPKQYEERIERLEDYIEELKQEDNEVKQSNLKIKIYEEHKAMVDLFDNVLNNEDKEPEKER